MLKINTSVKGEEIRSILFCKTFSTIMQCCFCLQYPYIFYSKYPFYSFLYSTWSLSSSWDWPESRDPDAQEQRRGVETEDPGGQVCQPGQIAYTL